jgi:hypothetical protein
MAAADLLLSFREQCVGGIAELSRQENGWAVSLGACGVFTSSLWRLVSDGRVSVTSEDDGHPFGLGHPLDAEAEANSLLTGEAISALEIGRTTGDLIVRFSDGKRLEMLTTSAGYEGWVASFTMGDEDVDLICGGGGAMSVVRVRSGTTPQVVFGEPIDLAD